MAGAHETAGRQSYIFSADPIVSEKTMLSKFRLVFISALLVTAISASSVMSVRADGNLLRGFDVPALVPFGNGVRTAPAIYWPIGIAFDGKNLWYSQPCECAADIFHSTTNGALLNNLHELNQAGALAWDGSHLWVAIGASSQNGATCATGVSGCALLYQLDVSTGNVIKTLDISSIFAADQECNFIDGLDYDSSTGTLWVSPDIGCAFAFSSDPCSVGFVYNIDTSGNLLKRLQLPFGVAGVNKVGSNLYMVTCKQPDTPQRPVLKTTLDGTVISKFSTVSVSGQRESAEDLAFDPITFAPACALWVVQDYGFPFDASLAAYQIACP